MAKISSASYKKMFNGLFYITSYAVCTVDARDVVKMTVESTMARLDMYLVGLTAIGMRKVVYAKKQLFQRILHRLSEENANHS